MVEKSDTHRVLHVNTFNTGQVASRLCNTLTDAHNAVVKESSGVAIGRIGITETCGRVEGRERTQ